MRKRNIPPYLLPEDEKLSANTDAVDSTREKKKASLTRLSRITTYSKGAKEEGYFMKKYPRVPRGELPGREHCGEPVSVRARLQEKQEILGKYAMGKTK